MSGGDRSKPSHESLCICWEGAGASLHWGVLVYVGRGAVQAFTREFGYMLGAGRSKPLLGSLCICWERGEQVFIREFGYMLGGRKSKSSLGSWMDNFILRRMPVFGYIVGQSKPSLGGEQAFSREFGRTLCFAVRSYISEYTDDLQTQL